MTDLNLTENECERVAVIQRRFDAESIASNPCFEKQKFCVCDKSVDGFIFAFIGDNTVFCTPSDDGAKQMRASGVNVLQACNDAIVEYAEKQSLDMEDCRVDCLIA